MVVMIVGVIVCHSADYNGTIALIKPPLGIALGQENNP
jgi:hypothetical protein